MQLAFALKYPFDDKDWLQKLLILAGVGILSLIPIFGLLVAAVGLGFLVQLARNVRQGHPLPLPKWNDWRVKFELGGQLLLAILLYHLPLVLLSICFSTSLSGVGVSIMGPPIAYTFALCCITPLIIIYTVLIWPMLAIGVAEYIETNEWQRFYRFPHQWDVLQNNFSLAFRWLFYTLMVNVVLGLLLFIPCLGWLVILVFGYPVHGHLLGQFAHQLSLTNKPQAAPKPKAKPRRR